MERRDLLLLAIFVPPPYTFLQCALHPSNSLHVHYPYFNQPSKHHKIPHLIHLPPPSSSSVSRVLFMHCISVLQVCMNLLGKLFLWTGAVTIPLKGLFMASCPSFKTIFATFCNNWQHRCEVRLMVHGEVIGSVGYVQFKHWEIIEAIH